MEIPERDYDMNDHDEGERPRAADPSPQQFTEAAALDWLDRRLSEGRGALTFCATEGDGCPGLFIDGRPKAIGTGDSIVEAIWDAERNWKGWDGAGEAVEYVQVCSCATGAFGSRKLDPSCPIHGKPQLGEATHQPGDPVVYVDMGSGDTASPPPDHARSVGLTHEQSQTDTTSKGEPGTAASPGATQSAEPRASVSLPDDVIADLKAVRVMLLTIRNGGVTPDAIPLVCEQLAEDISEAVERLAQKEG